MEFSQGPQILLWHLQKWHFGLFHSYSPCCGLNVCVHPKTICWNSTPGVIVLGGGAFGRQLGLGDVIREALLNETGVFMSIMTSLLPVSALHHMRVQEVSRLHLSKRALIRTQPGWRPHFRIPGSRTTTLKFQLFIIHPAYNFSSIAPGTAWDAFWLVFHLSF